MKEKRTSKQRVVDVPRQREIVCLCREKRPENDIGSIVDCTDD